ncbi:hypothetical protein ACOWPK_19730 [Pseudomonas aeruginosa]|uniref:hypothetical protein n=1 Tax=Pseudomonas aeruginosa TaxID=287 RepID=UPI0012987A9E|nr:hypothetical protein [Pseudomonas aeruginosa]MBX6029598.1 hypothetical protein [Pseudomonas aeruginosa]MCO3570010.1 hypothetical protein [Pseudomonas aeruginosa]HEP8042913.1 hypothetical protein [Pseudomonas aeruginosa]
MNAESPVKNLKIPKELVFEFLAVFSRFEFSLKESGYFRKGRNDIAEADWAAFTESMNLHFEQVNSKDLSSAIEYLIQEPPQQQIVEGDSLKWRSITFKLEQTLAAKVLLAVRMTRNNLFHGGKYFPQSADGRDEKLIVASLAVLDFCIAKHEDVKFDYETYVF